MSGRREAKRLTRNAYRVLAALLLADGAWVGRKTLAGSLFGRPVVPFAISRYVRLLERLGGIEIERRYGLGYRLATLPADEHLEPLLAVVPMVKQSRWRMQRDGWERTA